MHIERAKLHTQVSLWEHGPGPPGQVPSDLSGPAAMASSLAGQLNTFVETPPRLCRGPLPTHLLSFFWEGPQESRGPRLDILPGPFSLRRPCRVTKGQRSVSCHGPQGGLGTLKAFIKDGDWGAYGGGRGPGKVGHKSITPRFPELSCNKFRVGSFHISVGLWVP